MKNQLKHSESGRTMLEMLGVLGIMGIIMYGAIAGINYGMSTYKINQTYNEVQEAVRGIQDLYSWSRDYGRITLKDLCENDIFTNSCTGCPASCSILDSFAGGISVFPADCDDGVCSSFELRYEIPKDDAARNRLNEMEWGEIDMSINGDVLVFKPKN